jgi:hypothetical protein
VAVNFESLPDFAAIQQIAAALWRRRATVFVGAGFSRNAELTSPQAPLPPLWWDLEEAMKVKLYGADRKLAPGDPLKLAEEYRALFGQAALDDFVRENVRDITWRPGAAHVALLELPWSDVLTTNYDTLLERGAQEVNGFNYEPVRLEADLAHARAPRIVKLHGTIGVSDHFVFAEEDYRTYPTRHAAFVNFARQSFIENELCLLGFSGDDPNFLQWSGWVRDHLGSSTRRIYLVGLLELSAAKRKYLEARNIAPIDLAPLVQNLDKAEQHGAAASKFLDYLRGAKPEATWDWQPNPLSDGGTIDDLQRVHADPTFAAEVFRRELKLWRKDRLSYPGWLICPRGVSSLLAFTHAPTPNATNMSALNEDERAQVVFEFIWRQHMALRRLDPSVAKLAEDFADPSHTCGLSKNDQLALASVLVNTARAEDDDAAFDRCIAFIEKHAGEGSDYRADAAYQRALRSRDRRDLAAVEAMLPSINAPDPVWGLRRAALLSDLGEPAQAEAVVTTALAELRRRQRQDRNDVWVISRRAWAEWFARAIDRSKLTSFTRWTEEFRISLSDPWVIRDDIASQLQETLKKRRDDEDLKPKFAPGRFIDPSRTIHLVADLNGPQEAFRRLVEDAGVPYRLDLVNMLGDAVQDLAALTDRTSANDWLRLIGMLRQRSDPVIERDFSRVAVAAISPTDRANIVAALRQELVYWRRKSSINTNSSKFERLALIVELLARFVVCADNDTAEASLRLALELGVDGSLRHRWLFEPIANLAEFSLEAVLPERREQFIGAFLAFPTAGEFGLSDLDQFPRASSWLGQIRTLPANLDPSWAPDVERLLSRIEHRAHPAEPMLRLWHLMRSDLLGRAEVARYAAALWSNLDDGDPPLPQDHPFYPSTLLSLPRPEGVDVEERVARRLFDSPDKLTLVELQGFQLLEDGLLKPTAVQARALFDHLVAWRPKPFASPLHQAFETREVAQKANAVARALGGVIMPALEQCDLTGERLMALVAFLDEVGDSEALAALTYFIGALPAQSADITARLRRALFMADADWVQAAVRALVVWAQQPRLPLPESMADRLVSAFEARRWPGLVSTVYGLRRLVELSVLTLAQCDRLDGPLDALIQETTYEQVRRSSVEAISASLVRRECVGLANALSQKGLAGVAAEAWLELAPDDPLPEVRYALGDE